jgi:ABC-type amino acid transport substrate-binding protein
MKENSPCFSCLTIIILLIISTFSAAKDNVSIVTMEQVPYGFMADNEKTVGVFYEILNHIITESDIDQENKLLPLNRLFIKMSTRQDMCSLIADTPEIVDKLDLVEPIGFPLNLGILPKKGIILDHYSNLKGLTIAVPLVVYFDEKFDKDQTLSIVSPRNYTNAVKMLKSGQVDAIAGAILALKFIGKKEGMATTDFGSPLILSRNEILLVCSHGLSKRIRKKLRDAVIELKSNGTIQDTLDVYFGRYY